MRRGLSILFIVVLLTFVLIPVIYAAEAPAGIAGIEENVEDIETVIDNAPIDRDTGKIDFSGAIKKSKAEERIEGINKWLDENAFWLSTIFGMVPELSWLFALNVYLILLLLVVIVLNGDVTWGFFEVLNKKIDIIFFEWTWANLFGLGVFLALIATRVPLKLAIILLDLMHIIWNTILPGGIVIAIIVLVVTIIFLLALLKFAPQVLVAIGKSVEKRRERREKEKEEVNRKALETIVKGATSA